MILIGRNLSPFTRRCTITMKLLGIPFERKPLSPFDHLEDVRAINKIVRVPALILDDGETLIDSGAILDHIEEQIGPAKALTPKAGRERRQVLKIVALALGAADKAVAAIYEEKRRPAELMHKPWLARLQDQARGGLEALEADLDAKSWFVGGRMTQADITAVVVWDFFCVMQPALADAKRYPKLAALAERLKALPEFVETDPRRFE